MQISQNGLAYDFAEVMSGIVYDRLPDKVVRSAKDRILDALSVTYNGLNVPVAKVALDSIQGSAGSCTIIARSTKANAADAAFVNAVTGHTTLQEDLGGGGHPGTYIIPVVLAIAEQYQCTGKQVLTALTLAYEVADRVGRAVPVQKMQDRGFRAVPTIGVFGAAAAAGKLLQFNPKQMAAALDLAANMAGGLYQPFADGTMEGYFHAGFAARSGIIAAQLVKAGAITSPFTLEGSAGFFKTFGDSDGDPSVLTTPITEDLAVLRARSKPFPACALNQDTMLMIKALCPKDLKVEDIEQLVLTRPILGLNSFEAPGVANDPPYTNMLQAQMSAKFTAIAALLGKPIVELSYYDDAFADPDIASLAERTKLVSEDSDRIELKIYLRDGQRLTFKAEDVPDMSWDTKAVSARFMRLTKPILHEVAEQIHEAVLGLDSMSDTSALMKLLKDSPID